MEKQEKIYGVYIFKDYKMRIEDVVEYETIIDYYRDVVAVHKSQPHADRNDIYMDAVTVQRIPNTHRKYLCQDSWHRGLHPDYPEERQSRTSDSKYWKDLEYASCKCQFECKC